MQRLSGPQDIAGMLHCLMRCWALAVNGCCELPARSDSSCVTSHQFADLNKLLSSFQVCLSERSMVRRFPLLRPRRLKPIWLVSGRSNQVNLPPPRVRM